MGTRRLVTLISICVLLAACGEESSTEESSGATDAAPEASSDPSVAPAATEATIPTDTAGTSLPASDSSPVIPGDASSISSACDLLTIDDLANNPFFVDEPVADGNDYGAGFIECVWTGDFEKHEVRVTLLPTESFENDFASAEPLDLAGEDTGGGEVFDSLLGIGRVGPGTTVVYTVGNRVIMVAVRTGEDGSLAADRPIAVDLGNRILSNL